MADSPNKDAALLKAVIERLSTPDRLDLLLNVITPRMWIPLLSLGVLLFLALGWSIFGRIPEATPCTVVTGFTATGGAGKTPSVTATVPAKMAADLRPGRTVRVVSPGSGAFSKGISGTIAMIAPGETGGTNPVTATIALSPDTGRDSPEDSAFPLPGTKLDARLVLRDIPPIALVFPALFLVDR